MKGDDSCEVRSAARKAIIRKPFSREAYTPSAGKRKPSIVLLETIEVSERVFQIQKPGSMSYRLSSVGWKGPPRCAYVYGTTQTRQPISEGPCLGQQIGKYRDLVVYTHQSPLSYRFRVPQG